MSELNSNLFPVDSPIAQNQGQTTAFSFDAQNEANVISSAKIRNAAITNAKIGTAAIGTANIGTLTFNEITGGTATLGGTANGDGVLTVKNASGSQIVKLDNTGIAVTGGSISIQDSNGTTIMDASGLVSAANFRSGIVNDTNTYDTTSTSYVDVPNMSLTFTLPRAANVLFGMTASGGNSASDGVSPYSASTKLSLDGTQIGGYMFLHAIGMLGGILYTSPSTNTIANVAAGTHTVKMQVACGPSGTAHLTANQKNLWYVVLGN